MKISTLQLSCLYSYYVQQCADNGTKCTSKVDVLLNNKKGTTDFSSLLNTVSECLPEVHQQSASSLQTAAAGLDSGVAMQGWSQSFPC